MTEDKKSESQEKLEPSETDFKSVVEKIATNKEESPKEVVDKDSVKTVVEKTPTEDNFNDIIDEDLDSKNAEEIPVDVKSDSSDIIDEDLDEVQVKEVPTINTGTKLDIKQASETVKQRVADVLNKEAESTVSISKEGDEWHAIVEVVEEKYLPDTDLKSMSDILAQYEAVLSSTGELMKWVKKGSRRRGDIR